MGLKDISIRISGLITEAKLASDRTAEELAADIGYTDRTIREKARARELYTLPFDKIWMIAGLAGYEVVFIKKK